MSYLEPLLGDVGRIQEMPHSNTRASVSSNNWAPQPRPGDDTTTADAVPRDATGGVRHSRKLEINLFLRGFPRDLGGWEATSQKAS